MRRPQTGQVLPLVALLLVLMAGACLLLARLGGAVLQRARAVAVADTAALAGAVDGEDAARRVATANGGEVQRYERVGHSDVRVRVRLGQAAAAARARPTASPSTASAGTVGELAPVLRAALERAARLLGRPVPITSGYRSPAEQAALYARRSRLPYPVAAPGRSMHQRGLAVDVPAAFVPTLLGVARTVGLCRPYAKTDPVHFEVCRGPSP